LFVVKKVALNLRHDSFTYVSDCHSSTSWIDRLIVNDGLASEMSRFTNACFVWCAWIRSQSYQF